MAETETKSCPFCGGPAKVHKQMDGIRGTIRGWFVNCNARGCPIFTSTRVKRKKIDAINEWNARSGKVENIESVKEK